MAEVFNDMEFGDNVDRPTFEQILDMDEGDDDEDHSFSKSIVFGFLEQAESTMEKMDDAIDNKRLDELSQLGHFLKGSSATLGFTRVKDECEKIQHYGAKKDETGTVDEPDVTKCLKLISESVGRLKEAFSDVSELMQIFYSRLDE